MLYVHHATGVEVVRNTAGHWQARHYVNGFVEKIGPAHRRASAARGEATSYATTRRPNGT